MDARLVTRFPLAAEDNGTKHAPYDVRFRDRYWRYTVVITTAF